MLTDAWGSVRRNIKDLKEAQTVRLVFFFFFTIIQVGCVKM